jgi:hypothetical protein
MSTPNAKASWDALTAQAAMLKSVCQQIQAGNQTVMALSTLIQAGLTLIATATAAATSPTLQPALNAYVVQITGNTGYNYLPDFQASIGAAQNMVNAAISEYPTSGGFVQERSLSASGVFTVTPLQTAQIPQTLSAIALWLQTVA